jgi:hypothetical protein
VPLSEQPVGQAARRNWAWLVIIGAELFAWLCFGAAFLVWIDSRGLWCVFFPFLAGCV